MFRRNLNLSKYRFHRKRSRLSRLRSNRTLLVMMETAKSGAMTEEKAGTTAAMVGEMMVTVGD